MTMLDPLPTVYLTHNISGTGGTLKQRPEDFLVEELPLYQPAGSGEHLYIFIQKREATTQDVVRQLARAMGVRQSDVGFAGLKDKHAVTRQMFSVYLPRADEQREQAQLREVESENISVLWAERHGNKLRRGHLAGNRFVIMVRGVEISSIIRARQTLAALEQHGVPNFFGAQRFGYRMDYPHAAALILQEKWDEALSVLLGRPHPRDAPQMRQAREAYDRGDFATAIENWPRTLRYGRQLLDALIKGHEPKRAIRAIESRQAEFFITSLQSAVFNHVLVTRLRENTFGKLMEGDLAVKHDNGALFAVDAATAELENGEQGRIGKHEVSPSGPLWGPKMALPEGAVLEMEKAALAQANLTPEQLTFRHPPGTRRALRCFLSNVDISGGADENGPYLKLAFDLPAGCFATTVLREIMKPEDETQLPEESE